VFSFEDSVTLCFFYLFTTLPYAAEGGARDYFAIVRLQLQCGW
jgi:hypothetical protein